MPGLNKENQYCYHDAKASHHHLLNPVSSSNKSPMRNAKSACLARMAGASVVLMTFLSAGEMNAANTLTNSGFETAALAGWSTFGPNNSSQTDAGVAHGGVSYSKVYGQFNGSTNYTGFYQDNPSAPGAIYSADGWVCSLASDNIKGQDLIWLEVSFRDASQNALALYRSAVVSSNNIAGFGGLNTWFDLQITNQCSFTNPVKLILLPGTVTSTVTSLVAPAGTAYVRYQIVFQQGPDNANGSMYFDDLALNQTGGTIITPPPPNQWNIVWSDEFSGLSINTNNWLFETNGGGGGNNELEYYTGRTNNARIVNGQLIIEADKENYHGSSYTSARMKTQGKWSWTYGRIEARIKIPRGQGIWPAFWMLGTNINSVGWPTCGEIDIMENIGKTSEQNLVHGTIHGPQSGGDYNGGAGVTTSYSLPEERPSPMTFTFTPWNGRITRSNGSWTPISISRPRPPVCPAARPGSSRSRNSFCSTSRSAATGPAIPMEQQSFPSKCWWIMCVFMSKHLRSRFPRPNPMAACF